MQRARAPTLKVDDIANATMDDVVLNVYFMPPTMFPGCGKTSQLAAKVKFKPPRRRPRLNEPMGGAFSKGC